MFEFSDFLFSLFFFFLLVFIIPSSTNTIRLYLMRCSLYRLTGLAEVTSNTIILVTMQQIVTLIQNFPNLIR